MFQKRQYGLVAAIGVMLLATLPVLPAAADTLTVNGVKMRAVLVMNFAANNLVVKQQGRTLYIPIDTVQQIELGGEDELNRAETLAAKGDKGMVAAYETASKKARGTWKPALVKKRLEMAQAGQFPLPVKKQPPPQPPKPEPKPEPKPQPKPEPKPEPKPASKPEGYVEVPPGTDETTRAMAGPRNLFEACRELPVDPRQASHWKNLDDKQRQQALREYEDGEKKWHARYAVRGKPVTWTLTVTSAKKRGSRIVMEAREGEQIVIEVIFSETVSPTLPQLRSGDKIRVTATLRSFTFKHGEKTIFIDDASHLDVFLNDARLADDDPPAKK